MFSYYKFQKNRKCFLSPGSADIFQIQIHGCLDIFEIQVHGCGDILKYKSLDGRIFLCCALLSAPNVYIISILLLCYGYVLLYKIINNMQTFQVLTACSLMMITAQQQIWKAHTLSLNLWSSMRIWGQGAQPALGQAESKLCSSSGGRADWLFSPGRAGRIVCCLDYLYLDTSTKGIQLSTTKVRYSYLKFSTFPTTLCFRY